MTLGGDDPDRSPISTRRPVARFVRSTDRHHRALASQVSTLRIFTLSTPRPGSRSRARGEKSCSGSTTVSPETGSRTFIHAHPPRMRSESDSMISCPPSARRCHSHDVMQSGSVTITNPGDIDETPGEGTPSASSRPCRETLARAVRRDEVLQHGDPSGVARSASR